MKLPWTSTTIAGRLGLVFTLVSGFTLALAVLGFTLIVAFFSLRAFKQEMSAVAGLIATSSRAPLAFLDHQAGDRVLESVQANKSVQYAALLDQRGALFSSYGNPRLKIEALHFLNSNTDAWSIDEGRIILVQPVVLDGERIGTVLIAAGLTSLFAQLTGIGILGAVLTLIVACASLLFSRKMKAWVSKPIDSLREFAQQVSVTKNFSTRLDEASTHDEISALIKTFNFMLETIEEREKSLSQARDRAEQAGRVKSAFLASMSHELRTPLHAIISITEEVLSTEMTREQSELMQIVRSAGDALLSIINDILDFSKVEAGKMTLNPALFELQPFMQRTMKMFQVSAANKSVSLALFIDGTIPQSIVADSGRLYQILLNLIGNALKFTDAGGTIDVAVARPPSSPGNPPMLQFKVKDTGIGVPADQLEYIFEAFSQIHSSKTAYQGTGLGLAISSRLVKLMGGTIGVESAAFKGSEFSFSITISEGLAQRWEPTPHDSDPAAQHGDAEAPALRPTHGAFDRSHATVLIVEDNLVNQKVALRLMEKCGYKTLTAINGVKCLEVYEVHKLDLILMDVNMPEMDGLEAARRIRAIEATHGLARVPIIAVTASIGNDDIQLCLDAGMDECVLKPFKREELLTKIGKFLPKTGVATAHDKMH